MGVLVGSYLFSDSFFFLVECTKYNVVDEVGFRKTGLEYYGAI